MKLTKLIFFIFFLLTAASAKAQFFSFYLSGADEEHANFDYFADACVPTTANVGDETTSPNGNKAKIVSIDGPSQKCANATPAQSISAKKKFHFLPSETAGLTIPNEFILRPLDNMSRFNGTVLLAEAPEPSIYHLKSVCVMVVNNQNAQDFLHRMEKIFSNSSNFNNGYVVKNEEFSLNGIKGYQSQVNTTVFGIPNVTLLLTSYAYKDKVIWIQVMVPINEFELSKTYFTQIPLSLTGLRGDGPISPSKFSPAIDQFKQQCKDLGFKPGTEKFGNCVLELNK